MYDFDKHRGITTNDTIPMPASVTERPRRITEITISAMLVMARMVVSEVPQALFKLLGKISLYSFVLTFHLAFVIYHSTKSTSNDARGSRKPGQPGVSTRDYRFLSMKFSSGFLGEFVSPHNEGDTNFVANIPCPRLRSSTISSEITRHSPSNISIVTPVKRTNLSQEAADAYPATPVLTRKHGTIFPDSEWATMNSTQIRRIRRAVKRVKYKEEHGLLPRGVRSKASKKEEENIMKNSREHEEKINEEDEQEDDYNDNQMKDDKDDQKFVEKYHEGVKEDNTENDNEGFEGLTDDTFVYDNEGVDEDFMKKDDEVKEGATAGDNELTEDDSRDVEEQFAREDDMKKNVVEYEDICLEEDFMKSEEDVTKVDIEGVEANVAVYEITIVGEILNDNECVDESVKESDYECVQDNVLQEHDEVIVNEDDNQDHTTTTADGTCTSKLTPPTHHRNLDLRNGVTTIPSLIKGWPPVLLSESIIDKLDPIDFKIMQLECEYHLSREELHNNCFV
ncbi:hypothetical protein BDR04DRAFT_1096512 [Suillus decipiens]|nr:hypothetical protein BDR04DRAFT_1096512 [Suillus decipiens]